jgi:hypothetical protein
MKMDDLPKILNQIRDNLNNNGECIIQKIANLGKLTIKSIN